MEDRCWLSRRLFRDFDRAEEFTLDAHSMLEDRMDTRLATMPVGLRETTDIQAPSTQKHLVTTEAVVRDVFQFDLTGAGASSLLPQPVF
jgi:hypothetical protein